MGQRISATRIVATTIGVVAGLLGLEHGYFETLQGNAAPSAALIAPSGHRANPRRRGTLAKRLSRSSPASSSPACSR